MTQSTPSLSPTSRVLASVSTVGMLAIIYMLVFSRTLAEWWHWAIAAGVFIGPAIAIAFVERRESKH